MVRIKLDRALCAETRKLNSEGDPFVDRKTYGEAKYSIHHHPLVDETDLAETGTLLSWRGNGIEFHKQQS